MRSFLLEDHNAYLRYHDIPGEEPAVVYLHGLGSAASADYPEIVAQPGLAGRRSLLVDFLGFGFSDRPLRFGYSLADHARSVTALLDHLGLRGCALVGHSMGGSVAIVLAHLRPDLVSRLVVAEGNLDPGGGSISTPVAANSEEEFVREGHDAFLAAIMAEGAAGESSAYTYVATFGAAAPHALHRSAVGLVEGSRPTMREILIRLPMPRVYLFGERSLPDPDTDYLTSQGIAVMTIANASHAMMFDNPIAFAQAISAALAH